MAWLDDVHLSENQKFSDVVQKLEPVLTRAVATSQPGPRRENNMRKEQRSIDLSSRNQIYSLYSDFDSRTPKVVRFVNAVPPAEHLATFHWLFDTLDSDSSRSISRAFLPRGARGSSRPTR